MRGQVIERRCSLALWTFVFIPFVLFFTLWARKSLEHWLYSFSLSNTFIWPSVILRPGHPILVLLQIKKNYKSFTFFKARKIALMFYGISERIKDVDFFMEDIFMCIKKVLTRLETIKETLLVKYVFEPIKCALGPSSTCGSAVLSKKFLLWHTGSEVLVKKKKKKFSVYWLKDCTWSNLSRGWCIFQENTTVYLSTTWWILSVMQLSNEIINALLSVSVRSEAQKRLWTDTRARSQRLQETKQANPLVKTHSIYAN